jgi:hypothetical protein
LSTLYTFSTGALYKDEDGKTHDILVQVVWDRSGFVTTTQPSVSVPTNDLVLCRPSFSISKGVDITFLLHRGGMNSPVLRTVFRVDLIQSQNSGGGVYKRARLGGPGAC